MPLHLALLALLACAGTPSATAPVPAPPPPASPAPPVAPPLEEAAAVGKACLSEADCGPEMVCEGQGCGEDSPGRCQSALRACTMDLQPWCGCDGQTFHASGSCPGRRFAARGECGG